MDPNPIATKTDSSHFFKHVRNKKILAIATIGIISVGAIYLLIRHFTKSTTPSKSNTALHRAAKNNDSRKVIELLEGEKHSVDEKNSNGLAAIHFATRKGHTQTVKVLLTKGADIELPASRNQTPLHLASRRGHVEVVKLLLKHGANSEAKAYRNKTPLDLAREQRHTDIVKLLEEAKAQQAPTTL